MLEFEEYKVKLNNLKPELEELYTSLGLEQAKREVEELEIKSSQPGFWDNPEESQKIVSRMGSLKGKVEAYNKMTELCDDLLTICEMAIEENDESMLEELESGYKELEDGIAEQKLRTLLTGEYDCAATRRTTRKGEPPLRSWFARKFYQIINKMSDTEIVDGARDFRLMSRKMTDAVLSMAEYNRFSKGIFSWVGFKTKWFDYENIERVAGTTKWNFWGLFKYSIEGIVGFSTTPLLMAAGAGVLFCILAFIGILFVVVRALMFGDPTSGWPSMVCIILLCSGVQLFCTGIVGEYLAKTYLEVKHRPIYIVAETEENKK